MPDPRATLLDIAKGSFGRVIEKNDRLMFIQSSEKIKNSVLREFVSEAKNDGFDAETLVAMLLDIDQAVEENHVRKTLSEYLN